jgi:hypothetical protein
MKTPLLLLTACCLCLADTPTASVNKTPAQSEPSNFWKETPRVGPQVHGYFEGRSPCQEIARLLNVSGRESCIKIKWQLLLFQDPVTRVPTTYALGGFAWRNPPRTGKWVIAKGTKEDPNAVVFQLDPDEPKGFLSLLKADENILLFLDRDRNPLIGNSRFSFTLNRATK